MITKPLTDPDKVTAQLRQPWVFQQQRKEMGFKNVPLSAINAELEIIARLFEAQSRMMINDLGERVRRSIEGK